MCSIAFIVESTSAGNCGPHLLPNTVNCCDSLAAVREGCCVQHNRDLIMLGTRNGLDSTFVVSLRQIAAALAPLGGWLVFAMLWWVQISWTSYDPPAWKSSKEAVAVLLHAYFTLDNWYSKTWKRPNLLLWDRNNSLGQQRKGVSYCPASEHCLSCRLQSLCCLIWLHSSKFGLLPHGHYACPLGSPHPASPFPLAPLLACTASLSFACGGQSKKSMFLDLSYILHCWSLHLLPCPWHFREKCLVSLLRKKKILFHTLSASKFDVSNYWEMRQNMQSGQPTRWCVAADIKIQLLPSFLPPPHLPKAAGVSQACPVTRRFPSPSYFDSSSVDLISQDGGETVS